MRMPARRFARFLRYGLAGAVVLGLVAVIFWPRAQEVDTVRVTRGRVEEAIDSEGVTRIHDRYVVTAPIAGELRRPTLHAGDAVHAGQRLALLMPLRTPALDARARAAALAQVDAASSRAEAAREMARAAATTVRQATQDVARLRPLAARQLVAAGDFERAELVRQRSERELASARFLQATTAHELDAARAALRQGGASGAEALAVTAPVDGVILRRHVDSAQPVAMGTPLFDIGDPAGMEVAVDVLSTDAERLRPGLPVRIDHGGTGAPLEGRVRVVEPGGFTKVSALGVEEQRAWVVIDFVGPREAWSRLGDAYRIEARFLLRNADAVLRVPASAVFLHDHQPQVFRVRGRRAVLTPVRTGLLGDGFVEVRSGLREGEWIIVHPARSLEDGDRVHWTSDG